MISNKLKIAIFLDDRKSYQIAHEAGLHPATLSKLVNGIERVKPGDPRVLKVGRVVGIKREDCFDT
ncbi:hypothetical protein ACFL1Z_09520 [Thermodesulfobacteriota bacterium]